MKHSTRTLLLGALLAPALGAQSVAENRMYFRLGGAYHLNDMKAYLGDRAFSPIYEIGCDLKGPTEATGFGLYVSYVTGHGDPIGAYRDWTTNALGERVDINDGLQQTLFGWRLGGDMRFRTPIGGLTLFAGFSANWWDGQRLEPGRVQNVDNVNQHYNITKGRWPEGKEKIGARIGAEYRITKNWGVSWDASVSSWLSRNNAYTGQETLTGTRAYKGINPVNPSWMNFAVQYRWSMLN
jgi:hypothetical protein